MTSQNVGNSQNSEDGGNHRRTGEQLAGRTRLIVSALCCAVDKSSSVANYTYKQDSC
ncbi:unnamed protein product [Amoebophrya sp. A120]|nr:unnamed protein product [Amoebophrya sp. A120]|eukprot:GSA120T00006719001.1